MAENQSKMQVLIELLKTGSGAVDASRELEALHSVHDRVTDSFKELGKAGLTAMGIIGGVEGIKKAIEAAIEAADANRRLESALKNSGQATAENRRKVEEQGESLNRLSAVEDDVIKRAQAHLLLMGASVDGLEKLTLATLALAKGQGMDAAAAANLLGKALEGQYTMFTRMGLAIDEYKAPLENVASLTDQIIGKWGDLVPVTNSAAGSFKKLQNEVRLATEEFGSLLLAVADAPMLTVASWVEDARNAVSSLRGIGENAESAFSLGWVATVGHGEAGAGAGPVKNLTLELAERDALKGIQEIWDKLGADSLPGVQRATANLDAQTAKLLDNFLKLAAKADLGQELTAGFKQSIGQFTEWNKQLIIAQDEIKRIDAYTANQVSSGRLSAMGGALQNYAFGKSVYAPYANAAGTPDSRFSPEQSREQLRLGKVGLTSAVAGQTKGMEDDLANLTMSNSQLYVREWERRKQAVVDYYDAEIALARESGADVAAIEEQKSAHLKALMQVNTQGEQEFQQTMKGMGDAVAQNFSSGMASAFVEFAKGTKSAKAAFQDFASSFLASVAQMIIQALILKMIKGVFGFADGGVETSSANVGTGEKNGGMTFAAAGLAGVESVSSPTYYPRFNVLAGEAGQEMLTVLSRPQTESVNGMRVVSGMAAGNGLSIASTAALKSNGGGGAGGEIVLRIEHSEASQVSIVQQAVQGARVQISQDLQQDTPISRATKRLIR